MDVTRSHANHRNIAIIAAAVLGALLSGCMHRRMTIHSNPAGARVLVDGRDIGLTPVSMDYTYYGTRQITLIKDGYETRTIMQPMQKPWYQYFPLEFISDNFLPFKVTNRHFFEYDLQRTPHVPQGELLDRANSLRSETQLGP